MTDFSPDWTSTADEVLGCADLTGKRVLITGVSAGIGVETARVLVARGAHVIGTVRNLKKGELATTAVRDATKNGAGRLELREMDLASLASVRALADALVAAGENLHLVIANAGVMATPFGRTEDGFETQFGTNHLGHFVLINRVSPLMPEGSRLVVLASSAHRMAEADLGDPNFLHKPYSENIAYAQSKTANVLFSVEFDRRHRSRGVRSVAVHPGTVKTELMRHVDPVDAARRMEELNSILEAQGKKTIRWKSVSQGAATTVWAGLVAPSEEIGGRYCEDCHIVEPVLDGGLIDGASPHAFDTRTARELWAKSEELVGERF